ncbi:hypothetical protein Tco_0574714, partial [Tanacetum coccineum]
TWSVDEEDGGGDGVTGSAGGEQAGGDGD